MHHRSARVRACCCLLGALLANGPALAGDGDAVAIVNGRPIGRTVLVDTLLQSHGLDILQQLIVLELARDESQRQGMTVTQADVDAEFQQALDEVGRAAGGADARDLTAEQKQNALNFLLQQKNTSLIEFKLAIERNAHLRKVVDKTLKIDEGVLREEFARTYGERVEMRHIQANDRRTLQEALNLLSNGVDFAEAARRVSQNPDTAPRGGLMEPFSFDDTRIPPVLRDAAFALRPGEVSNPTQVEQRFHILKLERRIAPENVKYDDVRERVLESVRRRAFATERERLATELFKKASIRVIDAGLKAQYDALMKQADAAGAPAAEGSAAAAPAPPAVKTPAPKKKSARP